VEVVVLFMEMVLLAVQVAEQEVVLQAYKQAVQVILLQSIHLKETLAVLQMKVEFQEAVVEQVL